MAARAPRRAVADSLSPADPRCRLVFDAPYQAPPILATDAENVAQAPAIADSEAVHLVREETALLRQRLEQIALQAEGYALCRGAMRTSAVDVEIENRRHPLHRRLERLTIRGACRLGQTAIEECGHGFF